jgi:hypothetical protein
MDFQGGAPFTLFDILGDSFASFRRTLSSHMKVNALFLVLVFLSSCVLMCALFPVMGAVGTFAMQLDEEPDLSPGVLIVMVFLYLFLLVIYALGYAMHQGVTFTLTDADLQGRVVDMQTAVKEATSRLPTLFAVIVLRFLCDVSFIAFFGTIVVALIVSNGASLVGVVSVPWVIPAFLLIYFGALVWVLVVRSFLGLSGSAAQYETLGPVAALGRSISLLRGHRLQMILLRIVWGIIAFIIYVVSYVPIAAITFFSALNQESGSATALLSVVILVPALIVWYFFMMHILSFDTVLEGAFFRRLVQPQRTEDIAHVFS